MGCLNDREVTLGPLDLLQNDSNNKDGSENHIERVGLSHAQHCAKAGAGKDAVGLLLSMLCRGRCVGPGSALIETSTY